MRDETQRLDHLRAVGIPLCGVLLHKPFDQRDHLVGNGGIEILERRRLLVLVAIIFSTAVPSGKGYCPVRQKYMTQPRLY